jgi:hypothetical protein
MAGRVYVCDISHPGTAICQFSHNFLIYRIHSIDAAIFFYGKQALFKRNGKFEMHLNGFVKELSI